MKIGFSIYAENKKDFETLLNGIRNSVPRKTKIIKFLGFENIRQIRKNPNRTKFDWLYL